MVTVGHAWHSIKGESIDRRIGVQAEPGCKNETLFKK
jgi:hypothetical protein